MLGVLLCYISEQTKHYECLTFIIIFVIIKEEIKPVHWQTTKLEKEHVT